MTELTNIEKLGFNIPHQYTLEELIDLKKQQEERQLNAKVVDKFTGEVRRYRSMANPGNYDDGTIIVEPSETDVSEYEPLETTIEKCQRSGYLRDYMARQKLMDEQDAMSEDPNDFDFEPSPVEQPGFDLSQAKELETEIVKSLKNTPTSKASESAKEEKLATTTTSSNEPSASAE